MMSDERSIKNGHKVKQPRLFSCLLLLAALFASFVLLMLLVLPVGRWRRLERLGHVPESSVRGSREGQRDWEVAEWTTWWGNRPDPKEFWKDRVIWNDDSS